MKHFAAVLFFSLLLPVAAHANQRAQGYCTQGGQVVVTSGISSTTKVMQSYPSCTVTVYLTGTLTLATIFSDNSSTPLSNPFTGNSVGLWFFYAANGRYDVKLSGGGIPSPFTIGDILLADPASSGFSVSWLSQITNKPIVDVRGLGCDNTGVSDCTSIAQTALNTCLTTPSIIYFSEGTYQVNGISLTGTGSAGSTASGCYVVGAGKVATTLVDNTNSTIVIDFEHATQGQFNAVMAMELKAGAGKTGQTGIKAADQFQFQISDIAFNSLANGVLSYDSSLVNMYNSDIRLLGNSTGVGFKTNGTSIGLNNEFLLDNVVCDSGTNAPRACVENLLGGGIQLVNVRSVNSGYGWLIDPGAGQLVTHVFGVNYQGDSNNYYGAYWVPAGGSLVEGVCTGCWFASNGRTTDYTTGDGFYSAGAVDGVQCVNCQYKNNVRNGVNLQVSSGNGPLHTNIVGARIAGNGRPLVSVVNTVGTAVTWVSGDPFISLEAGKTMNINSVNYTVSTVNSSTSITLTSTAGSQSGVTATCNYSGYNGVDIGVGVKYWSISSSWLGFIDSYNDSEKASINIESGGTDYYNICANNFVNSAGFSVPIINGATGTHVTYCTNAGLNPNPVPGLDPRLFGAKFDGSTDDAAAIQASLNVTAAQSIPQPIVISGATVIGTGLQLNAQGQCIIGLPVASPAGNPANAQTLIFEKNSANLSYMIQMNSGLQCLRDLAIDGNKANNSSGQDAVDVNLASRPDFQNVGVQNAKRYGLYIHSSSNESCCGEAVKFNAVNSGSHGISCDGATSDWKFSQGEVGGNAGNGFDLNTCLNFNISQINFGGNTIGVDAYAGSSQIGWHRITGNTFGEVQNGISINNQNQNVISNNVFEPLSGANNTYDAIGITNSVDNVISSNVVRSASSPSYRYGTNIDTNSGGTAFIGNVFEGTFGTAPQASNTRTGTVINVGANGAAVNGTASGTSYFGASGVSTPFGAVTAATFDTASNCSSSASPAVCGSSAAGSVNIAATATTIVVNTSAVTANSQIGIWEDSSLGTKLSVTCNTTTGRIYTVSARSAGTSFTITSSAAPITNPACLSYSVVN